MRLQIIQEIIEVLKVITDNNIEDSALLNVLNAKLANMVALKGCTFKQYSTSNPSTITYYGINFMPSGSGKDQTINVINNYFMFFVREELEKRVRLAQDKIEEEIDEVRYSLGNEKNRAKIKEKERLCADLEKELNSIRVANFELANPNSSGLYAEASQIAFLGFGGLCIKISELGDYLSEIVGGDASKKRLYNSLKDIFDGTIDPHIIQGDGSRKTLYNIPVQAIMYSDFENLFNPKIRDYYVKNLKTGMARRSFIYIPKDDDVKKNLPSSPEEIQPAFTKARAIGQRLYEVFNKIEDGSVYEFSDDAKKMLHQYHCKCVEKANYSNDDSILRIELEESFWKITKLAVIYGILDNPTAKVVDSKYVLMAIDFYKSIQYGLKCVLNKREDSVLDKFVKFFLNNQNKDFKTGELQRQNFINKNNFSNWWQSNGFDDIKRELWDDHKIALTISKMGNTIYYTAKSPKTTNDNSITCSVSKKKQSNAAQGYEFETMDIDVFKEYVRNEYCFCAGKLKNGERKDDKYIGEQTTLWLDIENGLSIADAQSLFKDYWYLIYTTRNHGKKGESDRFRVILKLNKPMPTNKDSYKRIMKNIIKAYDGDISCNNPSRHYYGSANATFYQNQGICFDWSVYDYVEDEPQKYVEPTHIEVTNVNHGLNDKNLFTDYGDKCLKMNEVYANHRDEGFAIVVGGLIKCVKEGAISHEKAKYWLKDKLNQWMSADFKPNAEKFMNRLERLEF